MRAKQKLGINCIYLEPLLEVPNLMKVTDEPNPWAGFKRVAVSSKDPDAKKLRKEATGLKIKDICAIKEKPDPHICLKCGSEISRGRDFNKKRHWTQKHGNEPVNAYKRLIVPKDHELARKLIKGNTNSTCTTSQTQEGNGESTWKSNEIEMNNIQLDTAIQQNVVTNTQTFTNTHANSCSEADSNLIPLKSHVHSRCPGTVQKSLADFVVPEENVQSSPAVEKLQGDISRMLVMLESLTIPENNKMQGRQVEVNNDVTALITASNLLEVKHPDIVVEILEDGCKVTCYTCEQFRLSQTRKNM